MADFTALGIQPNISSPFPINPYLSAISLTYYTVNSVRFIADKVLPRVRVGEEKYEYSDYEGNNIFRPSQDLVSDTGEANEILTGAKLKVAQTQDHALRMPLSNKRIEAYQRQGKNLQGVATGTLTHAIMLNREERASQLVFSQASYLAGQRVQLSGSQQWSHVDSNPLSDFLTGMQACLNYPNTLVIGAQAWASLITNTKFIQAVRGVNNTQGLLTFEEVGRVLSIYGPVNILVGSAWVDFSLSGQTPVRVPMWGKHCALLHIEPNPELEGALPTFGITAQYGEFIAGTILEPSMGLRGGQRVVVGESVDERIVCSQMGYFIQDATV
jgi:hypothetical protein